MFLKNTISLYNLNINTVLDVGAGTGAGSWAVSSLMDVEKITCLEREDAMANLGKKLMQNSENSILKNLLHIHVFPTWVSPNIANLMAVLFIDFSDIYILYRYL